MHDLQNSIIKRCGADHVLQKLKPFVSERRQQRIEETLNNRLISIQVAIESPWDCHNAFAVIRSCEIFGVAKIHIISPAGSVNGMRGISKGAMDWIDIVFYDYIQDFLCEAKNQDLRLIGAVPKADHPVETIPLSEPVCLIFGNENAGLSSAAKKACAYHYQIPMFGMTESLNLSVAAALSLYETTHRKREILGKPGDLTTVPRKNLQARYYLNSVNGKLVNALFMGDGHECQSTGCP